MRHGWNDELGAIQYAPGLHELNCDYIPRQWLGAALGFLEGLLRVFYWVGFP